MLTINATRLCRTIIIIRSYVYIENPMYFNTPLQLSINNASQVMHNAHEVFAMV